MSRSALAALLAGTLIVNACVADTRPEACDEPSITVEVTLTSTSLTPSDPGVCRGQEVTLVVTSEVDGFLHLHGYDEHVPVTEVAAGEEERLTFVAAQSGQFPIEIHPADDPEGVGVGVFTVYEP